MLKNRLRIVDGHIVMDDGSRVVEYLQAWQLKVGVPDNTPVNLYTHEDAQWMFLAQELCAIG